MELLQILNLSVRIWINRANLKTLTNLHSRGRLFSRLCSFYKLLAL